jgi:hypothetical protein
MPDQVTDHSGEAMRESMNPSLPNGMSPPEIHSALDTSVVMRLLTGQPLDLAKAADL